MMTNFSGLNFQRFYFLGAEILALNEHPYQEYTRPPKGKACISYFDEMPNTTKVIITVTPVSSAADLFFSSSITSIQL